MMHPEERERIEDVKLWAHELLMQPKPAEQELLALARGGFVQTTAPNLPTIFGSSNLSLREPALRWHAQSIDGQRIFWVLDKAHQDAIYSVIKQWRQEQEGV